MQDDLQNMLQVKSQEQKCVISNLKSEWFSCFSSVPVSRCGLPCHPG